MALVALFPIFYFEKVGDSWGVTTMNNTIRGFWQHTNGKVYAVECDTFGKILGGVGPLDPDNLHDPDHYDYKPAIVGWLMDAVAQRQLRRVAPASSR